MTTPSLTLSSRFRQCEPSLALRKISSSQPWRGTTRRHPLLSSPIVPISQYPPQQVRLLSNAASSTQHEPPGCPNCSETKELLHQVISRVFLLEVQMRQVVAQTRGETLITQKELRQLRRNIPTEADVERLGLKYALAWASHGIQNILSGARELTSSPLIQQNKQSPDDWIPVRFAPEPVFADDGPVNYGLSIGTHRHIPTDHHIIPPLSADSQEVEVPQDFFSTAPLPPTGGRNRSMMRQEDSPTPTAASPLDPSASPQPQLSHLTPSGAAHMVSISSKKPTHRMATAVIALFFTSPSVATALSAATLKKGDAFAVARVAGIMAAKKTSDLIPLAHPGIGIEGVEVELEQVPARNLSKTRESYRFGSVNIKATVSCTGKTGVEMEALTAAAVAGLTLYDMCKGLDKGMVLRGLRVTEKVGGKSGGWFWNPETRSVIKVDASSSSSSSSSPPPPTFTRTRHTRIIRTSKYNHRQLVGRQRCVLALAQQAIRREQRRIGAGLLGRLRRVDGHVLRRVWARRIKEFEEKSGGSVAEDDSVKP